MSRKWWWIGFGALVIAVIVGLVFVPGLTRRIRQLSGLEKQEEQARREVLAPPITTPTDVMATANIFWAAGPDKLAPISIQLPLSADPAQRAKQVLHALIASSPSPGQRTVPADTEVLGFYILSDGTAVVDFSDALVSETPSGILSEQLAVDSIIQTLANNIPSLHRLKILIHGEEVETLAGHVDLTGFFDLNAPQADQGNVASPSAQPASVAPVVPPSAPKTPSSKDAVPTH